MDRIIFSLQFELENISTGELVQLITPLDAEGQTAHARAVAPKERIIDLRRRLAPAPQLRLPGARRSGLPRDADRRGQDAFEQRGLSVSGGGVN